MVACPEEKRWSLQSRSNKSTQNSTRLSCQSPVGSYLALIGPSAPPSLPVHTDMMERLIRQTLCSNGEPKASQTSLHVRSISSQKLQTAPYCFEASSTLTAMLSGPSCNRQQRSIIAVKTEKTINLKIQDRIPLWTQCRACFDPRAFRCITL